LSLAVKLRPRNMHIADDWEGLLLAAIKRRRRLGEVAFAVRGRKAE
jgi:hypothetical protein